MIKEYAFIKENKQKIYGKLYYHDDKKKYPTVIFSHGFGVDSSMFEHYGLPFANEKINLFLFDFCGGGVNSKSDGKMTEMSVLTELDDLLTVFEEVKMLSVVDPNNLFLMGESQGGYVSALAGGRISEKIKGIILWYPAFVIEDNAKKQLVDGKPVATTQFGLDIGGIYTADALKINIYDEISKFRKNVLILHGDKDELVPLSYSEKATEVYENAELIVIEGAEHGYKNDECAIVSELSINFVKKQLR